MGIPPKDDEERAERDVENVAPVQRPARTLPPPIPKAARTRTVHPPPLPRPTKPVLVHTLADRLESPTALERALRQRATTDVAARARQLVSKIDGSAGRDVGDAAIFAYELGELAERHFKDAARAIDAYRRALELDPSLRANTWSLRRALYSQRAFTDVARVIDAELAHAAPAERADLIVERTSVADDNARALLEDALAAAPLHQGALLQLERVASAAGDTARLLDVWQRLAEVVAHPARKIGYLLELAAAVAKTDHPRARVAFDLAESIAGSATAAVAIAFQRWRYAEAHGSPGDVENALERWAAALLAIVDEPAHFGRRRELVAALRQRARLASGRDPVAAWMTYQQALAVGPGDPLVIVDLLELAADAGRRPELPQLVEMWTAAETAAARQAILAAWWARSYDPGEHRRRWRDLVAATAAAAPGWIAMLAAAECEAVQQPVDDRTCRTLADRYVATARAALAGTWIGADHTHVDPDAAAALFVQGAEVFAYYLNGDELAAARSALAEAGDHPAAVEATIELEDVVGDPRLAIAKLRELAKREGKPELMLRALRIARSRARLDLILEVERELLAADPFPVDVAWQHDTTLMQLGYDDERGELLSRIAARDPDPTRRYTALLGAARLHVRLGELDAAIEKLRELRALAPDNTYAREALVDALRRQQRWRELVDIRREELAAEPNNRAALHELAWVLEVCLADPGAAADAYADWVKRLPADGAALEGLARCRAALGDSAGEASARVALLGLESTPEARWLYARSLERADAIDLAIAEYRALLADDEPAIHSTLAALALVGIAVRREDTALRAEATGELASRSADPRLAARLAEEVGWYFAITATDTERAARAFATALDHDPEGQGALLGAMLVAAEQGNGADLARHAIALAKTLTPELAIPLLLRAAAVALVEGDGDLASAQVVAAYAADRSHPHARFVALEVGIEPEVTGDDVFLAGEQLAEHASAIAARGALVDDPAVRDAWELDRAEMLELSGQVAEAGRIVRDVVARNPADRRALVAFRRIAERVDDPIARARAGYELARRTADPAWRLALLREAAAVFDDRTRPELQPAAIAAYRDIVGLEPAATEVERLRALLREQGDVAGEVAVVDHQLAQLASARPPQADRVIELLLERARLLRASDPKRALADVDAILAFVPNHTRAAKLREELAADTKGEDTTTGATPIRPGPQADGETGEYYAELTDPEAIVLDPAMIVEEPTSEYKLKPDLFDESTLRADMRILQEQEQALARGRAPVAPPPKPRTPTMSLLELVELARRTGKQLGESQATADVAPAFDPHALAGPRERDLPVDISEVVVLSAEQLQPTPIRDADELLAAFEREAAATTDAASVVALRTEAGRLAELTGDDARARSNYEAAVAADPRAVRALRGLRRTAYRERDVVEVVRVLDAELAAVGPRERVALQRYRLDMLLALREHAAARDVIRELLEHDRADNGALLARAQIAFVERELDDTQAALDAVGLAPRVRTAWDDGEEEESTATKEVAPAPEEGTEVLGLRWDALWRAYARGDIAGSTETALELAFHVEADDPTTSAALAVLAQVLGGTSATALEAAQLSIRIAARDALSAQVASETALAANDIAVASRALGLWARSKASASSRAYAAARAAELDPAKLGRMWATVVELDPDDEYAVTKLRASYHATGKLDDAIALDLRIAERPDRGRVATLIDASDALIEETRVPEALDLLTRARARWPTSPAIADALAEGLAGAGRWVERARLLDELAFAPNGIVVAPDVMRLRAAAAWDFAARQLVDSGRTDRDDTIPTGLVACGRILDSDDARSPFAHGTAIKLAHLVPDRRVLAEVLARLAAAEPSPWERSSLALRRARVVAVRDPSAARDIVRSAFAEDPRRSVAHFFIGNPNEAAAAAAAALEERARTRSANVVEHDSLAVRAVQLAADAGELARALVLCARVSAPLRFLVIDMVETLGRRDADDVPGALAFATAFTRVLRDAELAIARGATEAALALSRRAVELSAGDPVAVVAHVQAGARFGQPVRAAAEQLELATSRQDRAAELLGYEQLANAGAQLGERGSVISALRSALRLDPTRVDLVHRLERELAASGDRTAVLASRHDILARTADWPPADRAALLLDTLLLAVRGEAEDNVLEWCRAVLDIEPHNRLALFHVERAIRAVPSPDLAGLYQRIAEVIGEPRSKAAFATRSAETFVRLDRHRDAVHVFAMAAAAHAAYEPALEGWRTSALDGALWSELLEVAAARDRAGADPATVAGDYHLAGVALMDMQRAYEPAISALQRVLVLQPDHADAFLRLRILLDFANRHDELVALLQARLDGARDRTERVELERELAELHFSTDRDLALQHYRRIIAVDPTDVRAHAAIADLASVASGAGPAAADAITARLALETDPRTLARLQARLGALYAGHDDARALAAYQRAAELRPDDASVLAEIAAIGARLGAWNVALEASERVLVTEKDPQRVGAQLQLAANILRGLGDRDRAERMLLRALETAPMNGEALRGLVELYADGTELPRLLGHLRGVIAAARTRIEEHPEDPAPYQTLAIANAARARSGEPAAQVTARVAAEIAQLLGATGDIEARLLAQPPRAGLARLRDRAADALLLPATVPPELHTLFRMLAPAIADVRGVTASTFGVTRKQRLKPTDPVAATARAIGRELGLPEVDVYVSEQPYFMVAEPASPCVLVLGEAIAADQLAVAFATGAALKLVQMSLAIPARQSGPGVATLVAATLRTAGRADAGLDVGATLPEVEALEAKLRRAAGNALVGELRSVGKLLGATRFPKLARDLKAAGLRAGFVAAGCVGPGLRILAGTSGTDVRTVLTDPATRDLVEYALGDTPLALLGP